MWTTPGSEEIDPSINVQLVSPPIVGALNSVRWHVMCPSLMVSLCLECSGEIIGATGEHYAPPAALWGQYVCSPSVLVLQ